MGGFSWGGTISFDGLVASLQGSLQAERDLKNVYIAKAVAAERKLERIQQLLDCPEMNVIYDIRTVLNGR